MCNALLACGICTGCLLEATRRSRLPPPSSLLPTLSPSSGRFSLLSTSPTGACSDSKQEQTNLGSVLQNHILHERAMSPGSVGPAMGKCQRNRSGIHHCHGKQGLSCCKTSRLRKHESVSGSRDG